jgi:Yip1 domain
MITALQLIFSPFETWEKISTAQRGFFWILCVYLLPLLVVALGIEGFLLTHWGEKRGEFGFVVKVPVVLAARYAAAYLAILLAAVFVSAKFLALASESFNVHTTYFESFTVMAYGFGPIILARILDGFPQINTWLCWTLGAAGSVSVLYHGVGMVLRPDQTKGFGLYLMSIIIVVFVSGLAHFAALSVLHANLRPQTVQDRTTSLLCRVAPRADASPPFSRAISLEPVSPPSLWPPMPGRLPVR